MEFPHSGCQGSGIVIGGKVFRGAHGAAGEIGHLRVRSEGSYRLCGGRGCLETVVGF
ncbi:ROK family protein [Actinocorallia herbida]|uniref:ROK family protein n=1 Tax=Actinocorallia herbida TaxID=58109 RepID=UPI000F4C1957|nr:ROK family protein [Actinocorallia herbida]